MGISGPGTETAPAYDTSISGFGTNGNSPAAFIGNAAALNLFASGVWSNLVTIGVLAGMRLEHAA